MTIYKALAKTAKHLGYKSKVCFQYACGSETDVLLWDDRREESLSLEVDEKTGTIDLFGFELAPADDPQFRKVCKATLLIKINDILNLPECSLSHELSHTIMEVTYAQRWHDQIIAPVDLVCQYFDAKSE